MSRIRDEDSQGMSDVLDIWPETIYGSRGEEEDFLHSSFQRDQTFILLCTYTNNVGVFKIVDVSSWFGP